MIHSHLFTLFCSLLICYGLCHLYSPSVTFCSMCIFQELHVYRCSPSSRSTTHRCEYIVEDMEGLVGKENSSRPCPQLGIIIYCAEMRWVTNDLSMRNRSMYHSYSRPRDQCHSVILLKGYMYYIYSCISVLYSAVLCAVGQCYLIHAHTLPTAYGEMCKMMRELYSAGTLPAQVQSIYHKRLQLLAGKRNTFCE